VWNLTYLETVRTNKLYTCNFTMFRKLGLSRIIIRCRLIKEWIWNGVYSASWVQLWSYLEEIVAVPGLENREYGRGDPLCWPRDTLYPQRLALTGIHAFQTYFEKYECSRTIYTSYTSPITATTWPINSSWWAFESHRNMIIYLLCSSVSLYVKRHN
jgi:hypothetical protein